MTDLDRMTASPAGGANRRLRVAPHNREAEESVLGAIMLSADAANLVMDKLDPDDFYVPAHQAIFEVIVGLYNANQPIDPLTVSDALHRKGELDRVGGAGYLSQVMDAVPTASNIEYYAGIVEEHGLRRRLISAGGMLGDLAVATDVEIAEVLDRAEQTVFGVAERRVGDGLVAMSPLLHSTLETIEEMEARGTELTGLATGFRDLDRKLGGLQSANLVIVAARPAMGKCLAEGTRIVDSKTGAVRRIEEFADRDALGLSHVLSLETGSFGLVPAAPTAWANNGVRETFEVRTRLGRRVIATGNHPLLTIKGWRAIDDLSVGEAIAVPACVDAFGVDELPDAEVALLGYLLGDGTLRGTTPRFSNTNERVVEDVRRHASILGLELTSSRSGDHRLGRVRGASQQDVADAAGVSSARALRVEETCCSDSQESRGGGEGPRLHQQRREPPQPLHRASGRTRDLGNRRSDEVRAGCGLPIAEASGCPVPVKALCS